MALFSDNKLIQIPKNQELEFDSMFFDVNKIIDTLPTMTMIIGGRGIGKTFSAKRYCIEDFLKTGNQFMWVRRTSAQIEPSRIFGDIVDYIPNTISYKVGDTGQLTTIYIDDKLAGFMASVSTGYNLKSQSFPKVNKIIYDEFLKTENERRIKNEPFLFLEMVESVIRLKPDLKILLLANSTNLNNDYFSYFQIVLDDIIENHNLIKINQSLAVLKLADNEDYINKKLNTPFGKLIQNTPYYDYAVKNDWNTGFTNRMYIDETLNRYPSKDDFSLCVGNSYYYFTPMDKYKCKLFISKQDKPSLNCYTHIIDFVEKGVNYIDYRTLRNMLDKYTPLFYDNKIKFDSINTFNKLISLLLPYDYNNYI